jgi:hypothetical protein
VGYHGNHEWCATTDDHVNSGWRFPYMAAAISAREFPSALILTCCRVIRLCSDDAGRMVEIVWKVLSSGEFFVVVVGRYTIFFAVAALKNVWITCSCACGSSLNRNSETVNCYPGMSSLYHLGHPMVTVGQVSLYPWTQPSQFCSLCLPKKGGQSQP